MEFEVSSLNLKEKLGKLGVNIVGVVILSVYHQKFVARSPVLPPSPLGSACSLGSSQGQPLFPGPVPNFAVFQNLSERLDLNFPSLPPPTLLA